MTGSVTFRFYAELNDFLAPEQRQRDVRVSYSVAPSVKDGIEALGVPHTEVALILVNGAPVGFETRLGDGDRVSVYPAFEQLDTSEVAPLRPTPPRDVRFVADGHLGTLVRYLRLLGFDTRYERGWADDVLADVSASEERVLLTRDRGLLKRRVVQHGMFVRDDDPEAQLLDVVRQRHLAGRLRPFTRCMACNGILAEVDKARIEDRLPDATRQTVDEFRQCQGCGQVYWEGAHQPRLRELVALARAAGA
jgi:hypothetical protein